MLYWFDYQRWKMIWFKSSLQGSDMLRKLFKRGAYYDNDSSWIATADEPDMLADNFIKCFKNIINNNYDGLTGEMNMS